LNEKPFGCVCIIGVSLTFAVSGGFGPDFVSKVAFFEGME